MGSSQKKGAGSKRVVYKTKRKESIDFCPQGERWLACLPSTAGQARLKQVLSRIEKVGLLALQARLACLLCKPGWLACSASQVGLLALQARLACLLCKPGWLACSASQVGLLALQARLACLLCKPGWLACSASQDRTGLCFRTRRVLFRQKSNKMRLA